MYELINLILVKLILLTKRIHKSSKHNDLLFKNIIEHSQKPIHKTLEYKIIFYFLKFLNVIYFKTFENNP